MGRATATLLERVQSLDGETDALVDSLRAGATRLAGDLASVETNMGELYDAASGRASDPGTDTVSAVATERAAPKIEDPARPPDVPAPPVAGVTDSTSVTGSTSSSSSSPPPPPPPVPVPPTPVPPVPASPQEAPSSENGDLDGARLVALNMALNGDSREDTDRYIAENYEVADRAKLLDEVYAAIEG